MSGTGYNDNRRQAASGLHTFSAGIQMQIALVGNDDVQLVPGSHARWDSAAEYDVRCADGRVRAGVAQDPFPGGPHFAARILDV